MTGRSLFLGKQVNLLNEGKQVNLFSGGSVGRYPVDELKGQCAGYAEKEEIN